MFWEDAVLPGVVSAVLGYSDTTFKEPEPYTPEGTQVESSEDWQVISELETKVKQQAEHILQLEKQIEERDQDQYG